MKLHEEFKLYENMWDDLNPSKKDLNEATLSPEAAKRIREIDAKIAELNREKSALLADVDELMTSSYVIKVDGTNKVAQKDGVSHEEAFTDILAFINKLTKEEKQNIDIKWIADSLEPGDKGYDTIISIDCPRVAIDVVGEDPAEYEPGGIQYQISKRIVAPSSLADEDLPDNYYEKLAAALDA